MTWKSCWKQNWAVGFVDCSGKVHPTSKWIIINGILLSHCYHHVVQVSVKLGHTQAFSRSHLPTFSLKLDTCLFLTYGSFLFKFIHIFLVDLRGTRQVVKSFLCSLFTVCLQWRMSRLVIVGHPRLILLALFSHSCFNGASSPPPSWSGLMALHV